MLVRLRCENSEFAKKALRKNSEFAKTLLACTREQSFHDFRGPSPLTSEAPRLLLSEASVPAVGLVSWISEQAPALPPVALAYSESSAGSLVGPGMAW